MKYTFLQLVITFSFYCQGVNGQIEPKEFRKVISENERIQLVDVRTLREYQFGHL